MPIAPQEAAQLAAIVDGWAQYNTRTLKIKLKTWEKLAKGLAEAINWLPKLRKPEQGGIDVETWTLADDIEAYRTKVAGVLIPAAGQKVWKARSKALGVPSKKIGHKSEVQRLGALVYRKALLELVDGDLLELENTLRGEKGHKPKSLLAVLFAFSVKAVEACHEARASHASPASVRGQFYDDLLPALHNIKLEFMDRIVDLVLRRENLKDGFALKAAIGTAMQASLFKASRAASKAMRSAKRGADGGPPEGLFDCLLEPMIHVELHTVQLVVRQMAESSQHVRLRPVASSSSVNLRSMIPGQRAADGPHRQAGGMLARVFRAWRHGSAPSPAARPQQRASRPSRAPPGSRASTGPGRKSSSSSKEERRSEKKAAPAPRPSSKPAAPSRPADGWDEDEDAEWMMPAAA